MLSQLLTTNHKHEEFLLDGTCDPEAEAGQSPLLSVDKHAKVSGWDTTLSKTHDMSKKSQLLVSSLLRVPPLLPMLLWVAWRGQCNCMLSCCHAAACIYVWQYGGVGLSPWGVAAGVGVGGGQEGALGVIFCESMKYVIFYLLLSFVSWLWDSIWVIEPLTLARCFSFLFSSLHTYTYTYTYCYYCCVIYFLVLTKLAPAWVTSFIVF